MEAEVGRVTAFKASLDQISVRTLADGVTSMPADPKSLVSAVTRVDEEQL
jgi:hypothetical protein